MRQPTTIDLAPAKSPVSDREGRDAPATSSAAKAGEAPSAFAKDSGPSASGAAPTPPRPGIGFAGGLIAAVIGAGAGVAGAWAVFVIKPASLPVIQADGSLEQRLSAVELELSSRTDVLTAKVGAVEQQVTGIASDMSALKGRSAAALASIDARPATPGSSGAAADEALRAQITSIGERLATLEKATRQASAQASEASNQVKALDAALRTIDLSPVQEASKAAAEARQIVAGLDGRVSELGRSVGARTADPRVAALARAVAATDALDAIRSGRPFSRQAALLATAGDDPALAGKLPAAASPVAVATLAQLQQAFAAIHDKLAAMEHQNEGVLDRLTASASRLVRVRPVDHDGKPVAAAEGTAQRVSDLLAAGDLVAAEAAWRALPQQQRDVAPEFGAALAARVTAEQAARGALDAALAAIAGQGAATAGATGANPAQGSRP